MVNNNYFRNRAFSFTALYTLNSTGLEGFSKGSL